MNTNQMITRMGFITVVVSVLGWCAWPAQAADQPTSGPILVAVGAVEDTFSACLARIPKDAGAGQRMMAELSCKRDEGAREIVRDAPHR